MVKQLIEQERVHYRALLRDARYAALADAEGFSQICFAVEALGLRLLGRRGTMHSYQDSIRRCVAGSAVTKRIQLSGFRHFDALYSVLHRARNDSMHLGAYARHATGAAIELCIGLEDALMSKVADTVGAVMVRRPITVCSWQPVAQARQLMLMHSFSFLPVWLDDGTWHLVSELGIARYLRAGNAELRDKRLGTPIAKAVQEYRPLVRTATMVKEGESFKALLDGPVDPSQEDDRQPTLWLVADEHRPDSLAGVLSPFELM